jgi:glycosyltransferase involved in cell wall biosynthesis
MSGSGKPRIHWVSPLPPAETDIAHYSARILPELAERSDLVLWTDAPGWDASLEDICPVRQLDPGHQSPGDFAQVGSGSEGNDTVFIHIGNSWVFHSGLLRLARQIPSVIVLHDLAIQELCFDTIRNRLWSEGAYREDMQRWYGETGLDLAERLLAETISPRDVSTSAPGFEVTLDRAVSVVTHTPGALAAVADRKVLPCYQLDLPFRATSGSEAQRATEGPLRLVQFGYIGPNRRLDQVLDTLSGLKDEIPFRFDIMGKVWNPSYIQERIDGLDLSGHVEIHGFVDEAELDATLAQAHLVFNLRHPTMGEASGSQLRIWDASAASVVTDQGWYESLPDETVFKIPVEGEADALRALLRRLAADREYGRQVGEAGRARLVARHGPARYADGIVHVARQFGPDARLALLARRGRRLLQDSDVERELLQARLATHL